MELYIPKEVYKFIIKKMPDILKLTKMIIITLIMQKIYFLILQLTLVMTYLY